jgi:hypothetical protein
MYMLTITTETYSRTESGKSWRSKPDETETESLTVRVVRTPTATSRTRTPSVGSVVVAAVSTRSVPTLPRATS